MSPEKPNMGMERSGEKNNLPTPGGSIAESQLYRNKVRQEEDGEWQEGGVKTPAGDFYAFSQGEKFSMERDKPGVPREPFITLSDGGKITFEAWRQLRTERFRQLFEQINPDFARIYVQVLNDYPELEELDVLPGTKEQYPVLEYTGGFWKRPTTSEGSPSIVVVLEEGDHYADLVSSREVSVRLVADMLGVNFESIKNNPNILRDFIFLHEIGHAHDYITNYKQSPDRRIDDQYDPLTENLKQRDQDMKSLPYPGHNPSSMRRSYDAGTLQEDFDKHQQYFNQIGVTDVNQLLQLQEEGYRNLESEVRADTFAAMFLRKHWKALGLDRRPPEKVGKADSPKSTESGFIFDQDLTDQIIDKCQRQYEGKYSAPLFGINVDFSEKEQEEIQLLTQRSRNVVSHFLVQRPANAHLQHWSKIIDGIDADLKRYQLGSAKGTTATYFGKNLKELRRFVAETASL